MKNTKGIYKIDGYLLTALMHNLLGATLILFLPMTVVKIAGHDGWMAPIIAMIGSFYILYLIYRLSLLFPDKTLIEYLPLIVGNAVGKFVGLGYILCLFYVLTIVLKETSLLYFGTGILTLTPEIVIPTLIIIASTYAVAQGIEVIGRTYFLYYCLLITPIYLIFIIMTIPLWKMEVFLPLKEAGLLTILHGSFQAQAYLGEVVFLAMLVPYCRSSKEALISGSLGNLIAGTLTVLTIMACIAIMGVDTAARVQYSIFYLADLMQPIGLKIFLTAIWFITFWAKVSLLQFILTDGISKLLGLKEHRSIIIPIAITLLVFSLTSFPNAANVINTLVNTFPGVILFFAFLIPTFLFIIAQIKTRFKVFSS